MCVDDGGRAAHGSCHRTQVVKGRHAVRKRAGFLGAVQLEAHLDGAINFIDAALVVDAELNDVSVMYLDGPALLVGQAQAYMVDKGPRRRFGVSQVQLRIHKTLV